MATYKNDSEITGKIGDLVYYTLNGKPVVRRKRRKLSKSEKKNLNPSIRRQNKRLETVSSFTKKLQQGVPAKHASDPNRHGMLVSRISKEILLRDSISTRDDFRIRKEHLHHLNGVVLNKDFPREILDKLNDSKFELKGENMDVHIPEFPLDRLARKPEAYKLWVHIKIISLINPYTISYVRMKETDPIEISNNKGMAFTFDVPEAGENEGLFGTIGFKSLKDGRMIKDVRLNGYVVVSV